MADSEKPRSPLPDNADPIADPPSVTSTPGRLMGAAWMTVKTRQAQRMAYGRRGGAGRSPIVGLFRFGFLMTHLWRRAEADDPFADWTLLRIEQGLDDGRQRLKNIGQRIDKLLGSVQGFRFDVADTNSPINLPLSFTNAYGYQAAQLVFEFDEVMRKIITARHVGLLARDDADRTEYQAGNAVRSVLEIPAGWLDRTPRTGPSTTTNTPMLPGCTRLDVREATEAAKLMQERLGSELPAEIVDCTTRPKWAPAIRARRYAALLKTLPTGPRRGRSGRLQGEQQEQRETGQSTQPPADGEE